VKTSESPADLAAQQSPFSLSFVTAKSSIKFLKAPYFFAEYIDEFWGSTCIVVEASWPIQKEVGCYVVHETSRFRTETSEE
jgi:hypothetical protein